MAKLLSTVAEASSRVHPDGTAAQPADACSGNRLTVSLIHSATDDIAAPAQMNARPVSDQGSRTPYTIDQYVHHFRDWLEGSEWAVDLFVDRTRTVGYAVHSVGADYYHPYTEVVYLGQFHIERDLRRRGHGHAAFAVFDQQRAVGREISLDLLATDTGGYAFWQTLGFTPYFTQIKRGATARNNG